MTIPKNATIKRKFDIKTLFLNIYEADMFAISNDIKITNAVKKSVLSATRIPAERAIAVLTRIVIPPGL